MSPLLTFYNISSCCNFGIEFADQLFNKFNLNIFQYSFGDGNLNYSLEINSSKDISEFLKNEEVINFYFDKKIIAIL